MILSRRLGLVVVVMCALSAVVTTGALAALPRFLAHPPGPLLAKALTNWTLTTAAGKLTCEAQKLLNTAVTQLVQELLHVTIDYEKCTAFGLAASFSPALYRFHASGTVDLLNEVKLKAIGCEVKFFPKNNLQRVLYRNLHGAISITSEILGFESEGTGAACSYAREANGTYVGVADVWLTNGGTLLWHAA